MAVRPSSTPNGSVNKTTLIDMIHTTQHRRMQRMTMAAPSPSLRPMCCLSLGRRLVVIAMNTRLSMPRAISRNMRMSTSAQPLTVVSGATMLARNSKVPPRAIACPLSHVIKKRPQEWVFCQIHLVGDTGIEPVASSVSGKRAPAAPIAQSAVSCYQRVNTLPELTKAARRFFIFSRRSIRKSFF